MQGNTCMFCTRATWCEDVKYSISGFPTAQHFFFAFLFFCIFFFVLQAMLKINGIFQNKIKVTPNECGITALGNEEICEKTHHPDFIVVRKHLLCLAPLSSNLASWKP